MSDEMFGEVVAKASVAGLLSHVTLVGGEPFIQPQRLLSALRYLLNGHGVWEFFIPTNGRWVLDPSYKNIAEELQALNQFVPHGISVAFSENQWNLEQLGGHAEEVILRWRQLEDKFPGLFYSRHLVEEDMKSIGRARKNRIAKTGDIVGAHCDFDDWLEPNMKIGFLSDYLAFWPDGTVRTCYSGGPILGYYTDDYEELLLKRTSYLSWIRQSDAGTISFGNLSYKACEVCEQSYNTFLRMLENDSTN